MFHSLHGGSLVYLPDRMVGYSLGTTADSGRPTHKFERDYDLFKFVLDGAANPALPFSGAPLGGSLLF